MSGCEYFPFVHFKCVYCNEVWVTHCKGGDKPRSLCFKCLEEELSLTNRVLVLATNSSILELDSPEWYLVFQKGVRGRLDEKADILEVECQRTNKAPCRADPVKLLRWSIFKRRLEVQTSSSTPEEYPCFREDGLPRHWLQRNGHRQSQRDMTVESPASPEPSRVRDTQSAHQGSAQH
ncbi:hypothetical protein HGM15179_013046 [Zosterops borbonicus]|uniref:Uncharacterized protein n=1 Tax=Zosterops borbonicus TaxID=364589 RepID=A0A8K1G8S0_9PASS|nr:hypothetical protein HGM15179_013046 [Zosterops borbonicus]